MSEEIYQEIIKLYVQEAYGTNMIAQEMFLDEDIVIDVLNHEGVL